MSDFLIHDFSLIAQKLKNVESIEHFFKQMFIPRIHLKHLFEKQFFIYFWFAHSKNALNVRQSILESLCFNFVIFMELGQMIIYHPTTTVRLS